jgi:platelet glycoprotein Ib alpha polypeptide
MVTQLNAQSSHRRSAFTACLSASIALGFVGTSVAQHQAHADSTDPAELVLLKDAAHVQMSGAQPAYGSNGLPIALDSTADAPISDFNVGDYVLYRVNILNRGQGTLAHFKVQDQLPEGITYQNSWVSRCQMMLVAPIDHLWVREDGTPASPAEQSVTFPCTGGGITSKESFDHCTGEWSSDNGLDYMGYSTLHILGRVNKKAAGTTVSNTATIGDLSNANVQMPIKSWTATITVAPLAADAQVEPIIDPSPCAPEPTPSPSTTSPSPSASTTQPSPSTSSTTPSPSATTETTSPISPAPKPSQSHKPLLARTGVPLAIIGGATLMTAASGFVFASRRRKFD